MVRLLPCHAGAQRSIPFELERKWHLQTNVAPQWWTWNKLHARHCSDMKYHVDGLDYQGYHVREQGHVTRVIFAHIPELLRGTSNILIFVSL